MERYVILWALLPLLLWLAWTRWRSFRALSGTTPRNFRAYRALAASLALVQLDLALILSIEPSIILAFGIMGLTTVIICGLERLLKAKHD